MNDFFGQDILLDGQLQAVVAANGEMVKANGVQTVLQGLSLRLAIPLGSLFYDKDFGSKIRDYFQAENTEANRLGLETEVVRRLSRDPQLEAKGLQCKVMTWDYLGIAAMVDVTLAVNSLSYNLVLTLDFDAGVVQMVIKDVKPNQ